MDREKQLALKNLVDQFGAHVQEEFGAEVDNVRIKIDKNNVLRFKPELPKVEVSESPHVDTSHPVSEALKLTELKEPEPAPAIDQGESQPSSAIVATGVASESPAASADSTGTTASATIAEPPAAPVNEVSPQ